MRFISPIAFISFFLSGAAALVYELTWLRLLKQVFGTDSLALSTMLTVFIGGIALGTWLSGIIIEKYFCDRPQLPEGQNHVVRLAYSYLLIAAYGIIEVLLALYALAVPFLLGNNFLAKIWLPFAQLSVDNLLLGSLIKFVLCALLLIVPTLLIGLSFPLLTELLNICKREAKDSQFAASNLYAFNTLGAIIGAAICGFYFLPVFGLEFSTRLAVLANLSIALLAYSAIFLNRRIFSNASLVGVYNFVLKLAREHPVEPYHSPAPEELEQSKQYQRVNFLLLAVAFVLGFINLGLEVIWTKVLTLIIGSSTYSLTIILIAVLGGISFGAFLLNPVIEILHRKNINYKTFLNYSLLVFAAFTAISSSLFNQTPWLFLQMTQGIENILGYSPWVLTNIIKFISIAAIILPVTLIEGLIFAFVLYLVSGKTNLIDNRKLEPVGTRVSRASYINTLGAIVGSFLTGFVLIPLFSKGGTGIYGALIFLIVLAFVLALFSNLFDAKFNKLAALNIAACLLALFFVPKLDASEISSGIAIYKGLKYKSITKADYERAISEKVLMHEEGINSIVTVIENKAANAIFLKTNGKIEAGMPIKPEDPSKADMSTQILLGQLPIFAKPNASKALMIGMGSGISMKSLLKLGSKAQLEELEVCEIEELVYKAADKFFNAISTDKFGPVRIERHVADARNYLLAHKSKHEDQGFYDLIISQPSDPWISANLFTKEFWQLASGAMNSDGLFVQWLQLYSIDEEHLEIALRTFDQVFPYSIAFKPGNAAELILVGSKSRIELDSERIQELIESPEIKQELAYIGINDEAELLANLVFGPQSIDNLLEENPSSGSSKIKILKYISKIDKDSNQFQPKLAAQQAQERQRAKLKVNTDDNMRLEFHTSKQYSEFYKTVRANLKFIERYSEPTDIIEYLALQKDSSLLTRIAMAHSLQASKPHPKLALGMAEALHEISPSPASFLTLHGIHANKMNYEEADSLIYQAKSRFADMVTGERKSKIQIFAGLLGETKLDAYQLASLAQVYMHDGDWNKAQALIGKAIDMEPEQTSFKIIQAQIAQEKILRYGYRGIHENNKSKDAATVIDSYEAVLKVDAYNIAAYRGLAHYYLEEAARAQAGEAERLKRIAIKRSLEALELYPRSWSLQLQLAKIYLSSLPDTQLAMMKVAGDKLENAIKFLRNALSLNPDSIEANYEMAQLQYLIANIDHAYRHSKILTELCEDGTNCVDILGTERMDKAKELTEKLEKIASGNLR
ncbi:MAG: hypothetical protein OXU45_05605 [Candidatus Melainabacteria bacterium]|nr:hypothetical protein [Candidatus Melainabacteria bacterium]